MNTFIYRTFLLFIVISFASCNPNDPESKTNFNYWNANTLTHQHLLGKVKTVSFDDQTDNYNTDGFIVKSEFNDYGIISALTYNYTSTGTLQSIVKSYSGLSQTYTTSLEYQNTGLFICTDSYNNTDYAITSFIQNLKSISYWNGAVCNYIFNGNTVKIINSYQTQSDTTIVTYFGNYPISISSSPNSIRKDITYYSNGMFKTYTNSYWDSTSSSESKYYFRADDKFQLLDSVSVTSTINSITTHYTDAPKYNENKDLIFKTESDLTREYSYVYDSHKNWIKQTCILRYKDDPNGWLTTTNERTITYWQ